MKIERVRGGSIRTAPRKRGQQGASSFIKEMSSAPQAESSPLNPHEESEQSSLGTITPPLGAILSALEKDDTRSSRDLISTQHDAARYGVDAIAALRQLQADIFRGVIKTNSLHRLRQLSQTTHSFHLLDPATENLVRALQRRIELELARLESHESIAAHPAPRTPVRPLT